MYTVTNKLTFLILVFFALIETSYADRWSESYRNEAIVEYAIAADALKPYIKHEKTEFVMLRHGWLNYLQGNYNESIDDYKEALELNSESLDAMLGATLPLLAQKRWREAANFATKVLSIAPWNYYAHIRLMICEEGQNQWRSLELHAESVARRYPADATILVYLGRTKARLGKTREARSIFKKVLRRIPGHLEATQYLENNQ